jgi:HAMP domain-containing protein
VQFVKRVWLHRPTRPSVNARQYLPLGDFDAKTPGASRSYRDCETCGEYART